MGKVKNKRNSGLADKVHNKRRADANKKKLNPFEVHINREKIKVLGKKSKHDKGLPGVSRAKAIQKRKETLGTEMKLMNKTNAFIDRRIGEKNNQISAEDRMIARFAAERAKQHSKKNIYNLADDEILTHRGQTLEQIEKFDDPRSDEEDEEGRAFGGLQDEFVSEGHFGGGMLSKSDSKDGAKSHKDLIEQLIAESKKRKAEKQKEKEQTLDLTEKLDSEWKDLQPVVFKKARVEESMIDKVLSQAEKKGEDYDKMMRELKFEKRGTPSDGLKSDEKAAKEEREKLEQWERERQERMMMEEPQRAAPKPTAGKHRSAEDLDDNFDLEDEKEFMLAYDNEGKPLVPENVLKDYSVPNAKPKFEDGVSDTSSEGSDDEESADDDESGDGDKNDAKVDGDDDKDDDESSDEDEKESETEEKTKENKTNGNVSDDGSFKGGLFQKSDDEENSGDEEDEDDDDEEDDDESDDEQQVIKEPKKDDFSDLRETDEENESETEIAEDEEKIESLFSKRTKESDNLKELLTGKSPAQITVALQKLIKSYDPGLSEDNKDKLSRLFAHLLQFTNDLFSNLNNEGDIIKAFLTFDRIVPFFHDLAKTNKVSTKKYLVELLKEKRDSFKRKPKRIPDLNTLVFFKLVALLYPTSDFRHPVTTPSLLFMSEILTTSRFDDAYSISRGIFLTALVLEYTVLSKRLVPSALNFLRGILFMSANTSILNPIQVVPPFKVHRDSKLLNLERDCSKMAVTNKMAAKDLVLEEMDDDFKIRSLLTSVYMTKEFFDYFNDIEAQECLFEAHIKCMCRIELDNYPKKVNSAVSKILKDMKDSLEVKTYTPLSREKVRPKALRLYEPDVQEVFTGSKSSKLSREMAERARLKTKYKREMKGALREIRRDKAFVGSVKIKQKIHSDNIRKEKVKQIFKDASIQQGELNKLKRMK